MNIQVAQIVRCCTRDIGDAKAAEKYCRSVSFNARMCPWSPAEDSVYFAEAADYFAKQQKEIEQ